ncbi:hypothetical protein LDENG_00197170 [Lucifuga dentata]|nr:hypothetical protein LDENG_00197170 [Lucifuga dentata]
MYFKFNPFFILSDNVDKKFDSHSLPAAIGTSIHISDARCGGGQPLRCTCCAACSCGHAPGEGGAGCLCG